MRLTTDANDKITLAEVISGHRADLEQRLSSVQDSGEADKEGLKGRLTAQLQKLNDQASKVTKEVT